DVKPANIKLTRQGLPVLIDLGLAKLYTQGTQTIGAALAFTPGYAPPEQYQASGATDQRTDVYGLGATLFYLLTGYQPTEAPARLSAQALPSLCALNPALSTTTEQIVLKAMSLDPAERQQDAHTLMRELAAARLALTSPSIPAVQSSAASPSVHITLPPQRQRYDQTQMCQHCGTAIPQEASFCLRCGAPIVALQADREEQSVVSGMHFAAHVDTDGVADAGSYLRGRRARVQRREGDRVDTAVRNDSPPLPHQQHAHFLAPPPNHAAKPWPGDARPRPTIGDPVQTAGQGTYAAAAVVAPLFNGLARVLPGRYRRVPHSLARRLVPQPLTYQHETVAVIAAILALTSASLSFAAILTPWMVFFALPALILAVWSLFRQSTSTPVDFTRLAFIAMVVSFFWPFFWFLATHHLVL
ncbi:MAG: serine/threonine protein kinase, partial [Ktedonobacterales bacterium]